MDQAQQIKKRLAELQNRGTFGGYTVYTDFLGLEEQSLLADCLLYTSPSPRDS